MRLFVKVIPVSAGTAEPVGNPEMLYCPSDVEADTILSFLTSKFGDPVETAWTSTERHPRLETGWIFRAPQHHEPASGPAEILCVPFIESADGNLHSMFEQLADQRQQFERLASNGAIDNYTVIDLPQRDYQPPERPDDGGGS